MWWRRRERRPTADTVDTDEQQLEHERGECAGQRVQRRAEARVLRFRVWWPKPWPDTDFDKPRRRRP